MAPSLCVSLHVSSKTTKANHQKSELNKTYFINHTKYFFISWTFLWNEIPPENLTLFCVYPFDVFKCRLKKNIFSHFYTWWMMFYSRHFLVILTIVRGLLLDILESRSHAWFDLWANGELKFGLPTVRPGGIFYNWRIQASFILSLISLQTFNSLKMSLFIFKKIFACVLDWPSLIDQKEFVRNSSDVCSLKNWYLTTLLVDFGGFYH